jgi:hypothetical protein
VTAPVAGFPARPPVRPANPKPATEENRMTPRYAVIHVPTPDGFAWPIVERVAGGWQSGAHHYPDSIVLDVRPLTLVDLAGPDAATADAPPEASDWRTRGCTIAGRSVGESCGEPVHGAVLVHTYALPLSDGIRTAPLPRGVLVCRRHFGGLTGAPPFPPDLDALPEWHCPSCGATTRARMADRAPRVWLEGDEVPADVWALDLRGYVEEYRDHVTAEPLVEVLVRDYAAAVAAERERRALSAAEAPQEASGQWETDPARSSPHGGSQGRRGATGDDCTGVGA